MKIIKDEEITPHHPGLHWYDVYHGEKKPSEKVDTWYASVMAHDELEAWMVYKGKKPPYFRHPEQVVVENWRDIGAVPERTALRLLRKWGDDLKGNK